MNDKNNRVITNDHMPPNMVRQPAPNTMNYHKQPTNVRPPQPSTPAPSNQDGGKK